MVPQEQSEMREFENMRKQLKLQSNVLSMIGEELYPERQRNRLQLFLQSLKDYAKITAVMIEHQHKSINTLPNEIKQKFPQLKERVGKCIDCCKKNAQLLQKIKSTLQNNLQLKPSIAGHSLHHEQNQTHQCQSQQGHSHSHDQYQSDPNKILNIFSHLCRQYSQEQIHKQQRFYVQFVQSTVKQFISKNAEVKENIKSLVVGCGMGRTLVQLKQLYQAQKLPKSSYLIQGHEQDPQYYLLAQYLLNHHPQTQQQVQIYPYIHNFSNHLYQQTPYLPVTINLPPIKDDNKYGITFGTFNKLYKSHSQEWNVIVTQFYNYSLTDILLHIQVIYKLLKNKGIWIDISTASFDSHVIPYLSYQEYEKILDKTQFKLVNKFSQNQFWYQQPNKIMKQWRKVYYRVMTKQQ